MTNITNRLSELKSTLSNKNLAKVAHAEFKKVTPKQTGNARANTDLMGNAIEANYPYALSLNQGSSKQAPKGMTEPTIEAVRTYIERELNIKFK